MRTAAILSFLAVALALCVPAQAQSAPDASPFKPPEKQKFKIFLLVGQSNMAGRGEVEEQDTQPHPRVVALNKEDRWVPAVDPIHFDKPKIAGVGLGTTFGKTIAEAYPDHVVGLVPCAFGGTSIDQWSSEQKDGLYANAIRRAKVALKDGTLAGILWHQGEADSTPAKAGAYTAKAEKLFADFRKDLNAPDAPVVVGTLGEFFGNSKTMNPVLRALPNHIDNAACVEMTGLKDKGDKTHFDAESYREMGRRYAQKWLELAKRGGGK